MAAALRRCSRPLARQILFPKRALHTARQPNSAIPLAISCGCALGIGAALYIAKRTRANTQIEVLCAKEPEAEGKPTQVIQTQRELRFLSFASVEYEGNVYMTPQDFLESVMEEVPRPRTGRSRLRRADVQKFLRDTPNRSRGSATLFRDLHDQGIISYTEYLFLLCVLTKPRSGFRIAFNMFDTDGNQRVDKKEFMVLESMLSGHMEGNHKQQLVDMFQKRFGIAKVKATSRQPGRGRNIWEIINQKSEGLEQIMTQAQKVESPAAYASPYPAHDVTGIVIPDTTVLIHFFGRRGNDSMRYEDFQRFMVNLQSEVLELEFNEFARGMPTITEEEFARILLRYTILKKDEHEDYLIRLRQRIPHVQGISFRDFSEFGHFLNSLDDFSIAMRMYTFNERPISEDEFKRAVQVCTGQDLNQHVVHTVFQLFDIDGDGHLSHKEFVSVMRDRLHRGFKGALPNGTRMDVFKHCVKNEMRNA